MFLLHKFQLKVNSAKKNLTKNINMQFKIKGHLTGQKRSENLDFIQITKIKTQMDKKYSPSGQRNEN